MRLSQEWQASTTQRLARQPGVRSFSAQCGEEGAIGRAKTRPRLLPKEHRKLVTQNQQFDVLAELAAPRSDEQPQYRGEREVNERKELRRCSQSSPPRDREPEPSFGTPQGRRVPELLFASARMRADGTAEITLPDGSLAGDDHALSDWLGSSTSGGRRLPLRRRTRAVKPKSNGV